MVFRLSFSKYRAGYHRFRLGLLGLQMDLLRQLSKVGHQWLLGDIHAKIIHRFVWSDRMYESCYTTSWELSHPMVFMLGK